MLIMVHKILLYLSAQSRAAVEDKTTGEVVRCLNKKAATSSESTGQSMEAERF